MGKGSSILVYLKDKEGNGAKEVEGREVAKLLTV